MTKVILQVYPTAGNVEQMAALRPIGRDAGAYQAMLESLVELVQAADALGYWGITHVEHHGHSEGLEISPAPLLLNLYLARYTTRLMHGQLGLVLPTHDPVRLAEEIAIVDHMLQGRLFVGMARGYQARWQNVIGQTFHVESTASDQSERDQRNRLLFEEHYRIMKEAWTKDLLQYDGPTYQVPFPFDTGIPNWPPAQATTQPYGVPGEVDADGTVRGLSVVPSPYTKPHPQLFQAFGASPRTLYWCGEEDVTPTILAGPIENVKALMRMYQEGAASNGRDIPFGQGTGLCRTIHFVSDKAELHTVVDKYEAPVWLGWYQPFGFMEAGRLPGEEGPVPKPGEHLADRLTQSGLLMAGDVDEVKRQMEALLTEAPIDYLVWLFHWGLIPRDEALRSLELFAEHIMPEFDLEVAAG